MAKLIRYCLFMIGAALFAIGSLSLHFNIALCGVLAIFICNLIYSFEDFKNRVIFLCFNFMMFVFLLSRPTISMFRGTKWWYFENKAVIFALTALFLSLVAMQIGAAIMQHCLKSKQQKIMKPCIQKPPTYFSSKEFIVSLQRISLIVFYITMACFLVVEFEKLLFMRGKEYEEFYVLFTSRLPYVFTAVAAMMKYALCLFLATLPGKWMAFPPLALYVVSALPSLIIGMRNPIVLNILFVLIYYFVRDILVDRKKWFGRFEKVCVIICAPAALLFLAAYNYIRAGTAVATSGVFSTIVDLFYKQGVSFDVLCIGFNSIPKLPDVVPKNYTFGLFIDYLAHGSLAQKLFGAVDLGSGNNVIRATYGNSFAHSMSYVAREDYLQGHGWGTSFLLETYADYGYIGMILFCLIFGALLIYFVHAMKKHWLARTLTLVILTNLFFTPRAEATSWLFFIVTMQFWVTFLACVFVAILLAKDYSYQGAKRRGDRIRANKSEKPMGGGI